MTDPRDGPTLDEIVAKLKAIRQRLPVNDPLHAVAFHAQALCGELQCLIEARRGDRNLD